MPASGNGIQLTTSRRLIVPAYHLSCSRPGNDVEFSHAMYSDDHGRTWSSTNPLRRQATLLFELRAHEWRKMFLESLELLN